MAKNDKGATITIVENTKRAISLVCWLIGILIKATAKLTPIKIVANTSKLFKIKRCLLVKLIMSIYSCVVALFGSVDYTT